MNEYETAYQEQHCNKFLLPIGKVPRRGREHSQPINDLFVVGQTFNPRPVTNQEAMGVFYPGAATTAAAAEGLHLSCRTHAAAAEGARCSSCCCPQLHLSCYTHAAAAVVVWPLLHNGYSSLQPIPGPIPLEGLWGCCTPVLQLLLNRGRRLGAATHRV